MLVLFQLSSTSGAVPCWCFTKETPWSQSPEGGHTDTHTQTHTHRHTQVECRPHFASWTSQSPAGKTTHLIPLSVTWEHVTDLGAGDSQLSICHVSSRCTLFPRSPDIHFLPLVFAPPHPCSVLFYSQHWRFFVRASPPRQLELPCLPGITSAPPAPRHTLVNPWLAMRE